VDLLVLKGDVVAMSKFCVARLDPSTAHWKYEISMYTYAAIFYVQKFCVALF